MSAVEVRLMPKPSLLQESARAEQLTSAPHRAELGRWPLMYDHSPTRLEIQVDVVGVDCGQRCRTDARITVILSYGCDGDECG